jgi:hypothetical protein
MVQRDSFIYDAVRTCRIPPDLAWIVTTYAQEDRAQDMLWRLLYVQMIHQGGASNPNSAYTGLVFRVRWAQTTWFHGLLPIKRAQPVDESTVIHLTAGASDIECIRFRSVTARQEGLVVDMAYIHLWALLSEDESPLLFIMSEYHGADHAAHIRKTFRQLLVDFIVKEECAAAAHLRLRQ